jgi:hypothetical protein
VEEERDVGDLFISQGRERWHASLGTSLTEHDADGIAPVVVKDDRGANEIGSAFTARVVTVAEAARGHEQLASALDGSLIDLRRHHLSECVDGGFLLSLLFGVCGLVGLTETGQNATNDQYGGAEGADKHCGLPRDFKFFK